MRTFRLLITTLVLASVPGLATAVEVDPSLRLKISALGEGQRDLGQEDDPGTAEVEDLDPDETTEGVLDINPALLLRFTENTATYVRLQGLLPTGEVVQSEDDEPQDTEGYGALREFWLEYGGFTTYPGEVLRVGLQRVRETDGLWWDRDIESVRWIFDTTLLQMQFGVGEQFSNYRTDDTELNPSQKDRAYAFASVGGHWRAGHALGLRLAYATDRGDPPPAGMPVAPEPPPGEEEPEPSDEFFDGDDKRAYRDTGWLGLRIENGYYASEQPMLFAYWAELMGQAGSREEVTFDGGEDPFDPSAPPAPATQTTGTREEDVRGVAADLGLRLRVPNVPLQFGAAYAFASGGSSPSSGGSTAESRTFEQTGLQSNRSRFTGTRTQIYRFNEALQADLSNLRVVQGYVSVPGRNWDFSAILSSFRRDDNTDTVITDGVDIRPLVASDDSTVEVSDDLGRGWDLVLTRHFDRRGKRTPGYTWDEEFRSNIRLRASGFTPGDAYPADSDDQYRVVLEGTLWL